jgi:hypothetical protein
LLSSLNPKKGGIMKFFNYSQKVISTSSFLFLFIIFSLSSCKKSTSNDTYNLIKNIETGNNLDVELVFECDDPLVAMDTDKDGNFYLASYNGDIFKISKDGFSDTIYSGIECCGFSLTSLTVLPEGEIIINDCVEDKDVLFKISKNGERDKIAEVESNLLSLASDNSGNVYIGGWTSEDNLTVNFNPNHLSAADYIAGKIHALDENGTMKEIYEGGLPMCVRIDKNGKLKAVIWGKKGSFEAEEKSYSVADLRHIFWVTLTEEPKIISVDDKKEINTGNLNSISALDFLDDGALVVQAISEFGGTGLYLLKQDSEPVNLTFNEEKIDHSITGLEVSNGKLYFINVEGKLYKVK